MPLTLRPPPEGMFSPAQLKTIKETVSQVLVQNGIRKPKYFDNLSGDLPTYDGAWAEPAYDGDEDLHVGVITRFPPGCPMLERSTILINAEWNDASATQTWPAAVQQMHTALTNIEPSFGSLDIELRSVFLARRRFVFPIEDDEMLRNQWNSNMIHKINNILDSDDVTSGHVNAVSLSRLGFYWHPTQNPITLYVALAKGSPEVLWHGVIEKIKVYLKEVPRPIEILFQHNDWEHSAFDLVPTYKRPPPRQDHDDQAPNYNMKVNLGADISGSKYPESLDGEPFNSLLGTLGCYLKVKHKGKTLTLALTNYHVVRPLLEGYFMEFEDGWRQNRVAEDGTALKKADQEGLEVQKNEGLEVQKNDSLKVEHPSRRRHNRTLVQIQAQIDKQKKIGHMHAKKKEKIQHLEEEKSNKTSFFDNGHHRLGHVWAASGFCRRTPDGKRRIDWALIQVRPERIGTNALPDKATWRTFQSENIWPEILPEGSLQPFKSEFSIKRMRPARDPAYKMGAATGPTGGMFSGYRQSLGLSEAKYLGSDEKTEGYEFLPLEEKPEQGLGSPGDSGAVVFNEYGRVVALLGRGLNPNNQFHADEASRIAGIKKRNMFTVVTPIEDIFEDIKLMTGATEISLLS